MAITESKSSAWIAVALMAASQAGAQEQSPTALVNQYCVGCHSQKVRTAGVSLEGLDLTKVGENARIWEKVLRKISAGQMPPAGLPHPSAAASAASAKMLGDELDRAAAANPNPGHPTIHRLNLFWGG